MSQELPKTYRPQQIEPQIMEQWNVAQAFHARPSDPGDPYCVVIPPPNVTAALHMGHALNNTLQDILIRWKRMQGYNTMWMPGTDHAGIATQTVVEKRALEEEGKKRTDFGRDVFVGKIQAWKDQYEAQITEQLKAMGCSCDWDRQRFTMDRVCARAVREAFFRLFADGLIYRGKRLVNWDPVTQTALADDEVVMQEVDGHFWYLKYPVVSDGSTERPSDEGEQDYVTVATTRPETMLGDTAVALNPHDPRAAALRGKKVRLPIVNRIIPIIEDPYVVPADPDSDEERARYSSGFLKVTPAHDLNDYEIGQRFELPMINVMAPDGTISDQFGWDDVGDAAFLLGLDRYEARTAVVEWFRENGLLDDVRSYRHAVGHSYRSHVPIEPYLSDQWYVKVTDERLAGAALRAMSEVQVTPSDGPVWRAHQAASRDTEEKDPSLLAPRSSPWEGQLRFVPARYAKTFQTWHENIRDWCISRQLWWGHRIPVWSKELTTPRQATHETFALIAKLHKNKKAEVRAYDVMTQQEIDVLTLEKLEFEESQHYGLFVCLLEDDDELIQQLESNAFDQDPDVLDTWFSSGLWPISTMGWPDPSDFSEEIPEGEAVLDKWNPSDCLSTAREIITLWVSRMVMLNLYFRRCLPFRDVFIHAMIQDGQGRKMSKSLGNGVDPLDIIHSHGADAMRFTLADMTTQTQDVRLPVVKDSKTGRNTSGKFDIGRNFANKLWNAMRFALSRLADPMPEESEEAPDFTLPDQWILSRLAAATAATNAALESYDFNPYAQRLRDFIWADLCDWYIEAVKMTIAKSTTQRRVLATVLDVTLRLLHPLMPFITEALWKQLNTVAPGRGLEGVQVAPSELLINARWPELEPSLIDPECEGQFGVIQQTVGALREIRTTYKVSPRQTISCSGRGPDQEGQKLMSHRALINALAGVELGQVGADVCRPPDATATLVGQLELYAHGLIDSGAEQARLAKRLEQVNKSVETLRGRLSNRSYVDKAPQHLVEQTRQQLSEAEEEMRKLGEQANGL